MPAAQVAPSGPAPAPAAPNAAAPANTYSPNPTMPQYQGEPQAASSAAPAAPSGGLGGSGTAVTAPVTVDPRDATYYDQLARLNYAYQNSLAGYQASTANDQAAYNYTSGTLNQQLPLTLAASRNKANSQGLLESGYLGQQEGLNEANYANKVGQALSKMNSGNSTAQNRLIAAQNAYNLGSAEQLAAAIARANKADLTNQPTTPPAPPRNPVGTAIRKAAAKKVTKKNVF